MPHSHPPHSAEALRAALPRLRDLLQLRLALIANQTLRESDPASQLAQLREVSEAISAFHAEHQSDLPPRLNHFLERASFQKAIEFIEHVD
ncbi:MAG TPA: hypothetical protein VGH65_07130 [Verrucomicrobiaceae bacterium]